MSELLDDVAFSIGETSFTWRDVASDASRRGEWKALERRVAESIACRAHGAATGIPLPHGEPEASALEFRYARDLLTARDAEAWLVRWHISAREWSEYFRQVLYHQLFAADAADIAAKRAVDEQQLDRATIVHAVCSGLMEQFARELARGAAAAASLGEPLDAANFSGALDRYRLRAVTAPSVADIIATNRLDWIRVAYRSAAFDTLAAAREAAMCVRNDRLGLSTVAMDAHVPLVDDELYLEEAPSAVRDQFLGSQPGGLIGPIALDGGWTLYEIHAKRLPSPDDATVRARAERDVLNRALGVDVERHVRWAPHESTVP